MSAVDWQPAAFGNGATVLTDLKCRKIAEAVLRNPDLQVQGCVHGESRVEYRVIVKDKGNGCPN